jgi:hypothetical protein
MTHDQKPPDLVVTKDGIPFKDQAEGIRQFKAACRRSEAQSNEQRKDERTGADRCWIWRDHMHYPQVAFTKPDRVHKAVEYMRVYSREEVERLADTEAGVDTQQLINSLYRTVDGQRREINRLKAKLEALHAALDGVTK